MAYSLLNSLSQGPDAVRIYKVVKSGDFLYRLVQSTTSDEPAIQIYDISDLNSPVFISQTIIYRLPLSSGPFEIGDMVVQGDFIYLTFASAMLFLDDPGGEANNYNGVVTIYDATDKVLPVRVYINSDLQSVKYPIISGNYLYVFSTVVALWDGMAFNIQDLCQMHVFDVSVPASASLATTVNTQRMISQTRLYDSNYIVISSLVDEFGDIRSKIEIYDITDPEAPVLTSIWSDPEPDLNLRLVSISDFIIMGDILIAKGRRNVPETDLIFALSITDPTLPVLTGQELECLYYGGAKLFYLDDPILGNDFLVKSLVSTYNPSIVNIDLLGNIYDTGKVIITFYNDTEQEVVGVASDPAQNLILLSSNNPIVSRAIETDFYTTPIVQGILPPLSRTYYANSFGANWYPFRLESWGCNLNEFMKLDWGMRGANDGHWYGIDASEDGQVQIAVSYGGNIAKSEDGGETWRYIDHFIISYPEAYNKVKVSNDAKYVLIATFNGYVYLSDDYGESYWSLFSRSVWRGVAVSDSGQYMVAGNEGSGSYPDYVSFIEISKNYGSTWTRTNFDDLIVYSVGISGDGNCITVGFGNWEGAAVTAFAVSVDGGLTFAFKSLTTIDDGYLISDVRMSYDGQYQVISDRGWIGGALGKVWVSEDYGATWTQKGINDAWTCIAMERNDHNHLIVGKDGWMRESFDFGDTWTEIFTGARWNDILISKDSSITMAVMGNTAIFNESYIYKKGYFKSF